MKKKIILCLMCLLAMSVMTGCIKVVKIGEEGSLTGNVKFDPKTFAAEMWDSKAVPELSQKAVDLKDFLPKAKGDLKSLAGEYGKFSMGTTGELNYTVKGTGTVTQVVTDKKAGYIVVKLDDYSGAEEIRVQVGTVFKGTSIRDSLSFIKFGDYTNQEDFAAVSQSINDTVQNNVINKVDVNSLSGKKISFTGCFTATDNKIITITPVVLTVQ